MFLNRRGFSSTAILAGAVHLIGCTYVAPGGVVLLNPNDGVVCATREEPENARVDFSSYDEILKTGRVGISCSMPLKELLHFDEARYQRVETVYHYPPDEVLKFALALTLGNVLLFPIFFVVDAYIVEMIKQAKQLPMQGTTEQRALPEVLLEKDVKEWGPKKVIPMPGQPCRAVLSAESMAGLRFIHEFSGVTGENGEWSADLSELIPLLRPEDDVVLLRMDVSTPGPYSHDWKIYLTARQIREIAGK